MVVVAFETLSWTTPIGLEIDETDEATHVPSVITVCGLVQEFVAR